MLRAGLRSKTILAAVIALGIVELPRAASAQSRTSLQDEAVAVCASQREPITRLRDRYREQIRDATFKGVAVGALAGALGGAAVTKNTDNQGKGALIGGMLGGIAGGMDQYIDAKKKIARDNRELSRMIDSDARAFVGSVSSIASAINATGKCRENQIATWEQRLVATRNEAVVRQKARDQALASADVASRREIEKENKKAAQGDARVLDQMNRENAVIRAAIDDDRQLFNDVIKYFDQDIMKLAEADAQVQGTSTASIRGSAEGYVVEVIPPALMANAGSMGSSSSAFGSSSSAFGAPKPAVVPVAVATIAKPKPGDVPPWQAQVKRPVVKTENGHQAALVAQKNVTADASAVTQTNLARLQYANMQGAAIQVPKEVGGD